MVLDKLKEIVTDGNKYRDVKRKFALNVEQLEPLKPIIKFVSRERTKEILEMIEKEVMFENPNERLSMSTLAFNQLVRDLLVKKIKGKKND